MMPTTTPAVTFYPDHVGPGQEPTLTLTATDRLIQVRIEPVTFEASYVCRWCQRYLFAQIDGGWMYVGIRTWLVGRGARGGGARKDVPRSQWFTVDTPPVPASSAVVKAALPPECPMCRRERWVPPQYPQAGLELHPHVSGWRRNSEAYDMIRKDPAFAEVVARADAAMQADNAHRARSRG